MGYGLALLGHEWGHFAGARWGGGIAPTTKFSQLFPIFLLDMQRSPERAFKAMSVGGNIAHWSLFALFFCWVPLDAPGRVALACGAFAFAFGASTTEFPAIIASIIASVAEDCGALADPVVERRRAGDSRVADELRLLELA